MKITKLFLLSIAVILFSCSDKDDPIPTSEGMVGTWTVTGIDYKGSTTTTISGITAKADFTGTGKDMDLTTTFTSNPNTVTSEGTYTIVLKTTVAGQTTTDEFPFDEVLTDGTWTLNGKILSITNPSGTQDATIVKQTSTTLVLRLDLEESESDSGITVTTKIQAVYTFIKK